STLHTRRFPSFPTRRSSDLKIEFCQHFRIGIKDSSIGGLGNLIRRPHTPRRTHIGGAYKHAPVHEGFERPNAHPVVSHASWTIRDRKSTRLNSSHSQISYAV